MTVTPNTPRWAELVRMGTGAVSTRNWILGDAALEIAPIGGAQGKRNDLPQPGGKSSNDELLAQYAEEVGITPRTLRACRETAMAWPPESRTVKTSWKAYSIMNAKDNQHLLVDGMTTTEAFMALGQKHPGRSKDERDAELQAARAEAAAEARAEAEAKAAKDREAAKAEALASAAKAKEEWEAAAIAKAAHSERQHKMQMEASHLREIKAEGKEHGRKAAFDSVTDADLRRGTAPDVALDSGDPIYSVKEVAAYQEGFSSGFTEGWNVMAREYQKKEHEKAVAIKKAEEAVRAKAVAEERSARAAEEAARSKRSKIDSAIGVLEDMKSELTSDDKNRLIDVVAPIAV